MSHHLAILKKYYLDRILHGSQTRRTSFQKVRKGDTLWLKLSSGSILPTAQVRSVRFFYPRSTTTLTKTLKKHLKTIQADQRFLKRHTTARFGSFIFSSQIRTIKPIAVKKNNQLSWVVLSKPPAPLEKI